MTSDQLKPILIALAVFAASSIILLIARRVAFGAMKRWAGRTDTRADDLILESIRVPSVYWAFALSLYIALDTSHFAPRYVNYGLSLLYVLIVLSVTITIANVSTSLFQEAIRKSAVELPATGLSKAVIKAIIFAIGFLVILNSLGISITPILTALGVGGLAVALALQDTLSNLFAGMHLLVESSVRVGDYIKLSTGEEGFVTDIGWRTTRIRQLSNNIIIIPNNKLSQSVITNFSMPEKSMAVAITIGVAYDADTEKAERVLLEEANAAVGQVKGLLASPPPGVKLIPGFGSSSLDFTLACHVEEYTSQFEVQHELRKRILSRFRREGIEIPFPSRTIHVKKD